MQTLTIGCSQNSCTFCGMYKGKHFRIRPVAEILDSLAATFPNLTRVGAYASPASLTTKRLKGFSAEAMAQQAMAAAKLRPGFLDSVPAYAEEYY